MRYDSIAAGKSDCLSLAGHGMYRIVSAPRAAMAFVKSPAPFSKRVLLSGSADGPCCNTTTSQSSLSNARNASPSA
jgi:hypothetical protein